MIEPNITKTCPDCGRRMVIRRNRLNDTEFFGCTGYPECSRTEKAPAYLEQLRQGAKPLPGF